MRYVRLIRRHWRPFWRFQRRLPANWADRVVGLLAALLALALLLSDPFWVVTLVGVAGWSYILTSIGLSVGEYRRGRQQIYTRDDLKGRWWQ